MNFAAPLVREVVAPLWAAWERSPYLEHYHALKHTQYDHPQLTRSRQEDKLRALVRHACRTTAFWKERFDTAGLRPDDIRTLADLQAVPELTKEQLRTRGEDLLSAAFERSSLIEHRTSGSTGQSVRVWLDEDARQFKRACTLRADEWSGWTLGETVAKVWGNPQYLKRGWRGQLRNLLLDRARYLDTLDMDRASMTRFADSLRSSPPSLLFGHAHSLYLFALFLEEQGMAGFRPKGIISTAMVLHGFERFKIEEVFGVPVTDRYGCEEVGLIASQCERHRGLHVNAEGIYLEVVRRDGSPAPPGEAGALLVTDLDNRAMPLLRYRVGDVGVWSEEPCDCRRGFPMIRSLAGREADYVIKPGGSMISGISLTENFATRIPGVAQMQILQETLREFCFRIVREESFDESSLRRIDELVRELLGSEVKYACEYVERIPQEPSGKYRFCISKLTGSAGLTGDQRAEETPVPSVEAGSGGTE